MSIRGPCRRARGITLIELMISMVISLVVLAAMIGIFVNTSASHREMEKTNGVIENGRIAAQLLQEDLVHAGFWGGYVPQFDDLSSTATPPDVPDAVPNACQAYDTWNSSHRSNLLGIAVQADEVLPSGAGCVSPLSQKAGTDVLIVRHAETCVPGVGNCAADVAGRLYLQTSSCKAEKNAGTAQGAASNTLILAASAATGDNTYTGLTLRTISGIGAGQINSVISYNGSNRTATMSQAWQVIPNNTTRYAFEYVLGTSSFPLHKRDCAGTGTPPTLPVTGGALADKRRFVSNIYYVHEYPHPDQAADVIPTLVRSQFDLSSGALAQQAPVALIEGIEGFRVVLGIDNVSDSGDPVDYANAIDWADAAVKTSPTNRGDGAPDEFVRCAVAAPCSAAQLANVVAAKLYILVRSRDRTPGHRDDRSYCLGERESDGTCAVSNTIPAANDNYKRHVFSTSVRLTNVSARRETPP